MPNTKLTKERLKTHLHYGKWIYVLIAVGCFLIFDLLFTMTQYRAPAERKVDFQMVSAGYLDTDALAPVAEKALQTGQAIDETLEEVNFYAITYSGDATQDIYGAQKYTVMVAAQEGDIYCVPRPLFEQMQTQDALLPLDEYISSGVLDVSNLDLSASTLPESSGEFDDDGNPVPSNGPDRVYGLPLSGLKGLLALGYDTSDCYAVIMGFSKNADTTAHVLQSVMEQLAEPLPAPEETAP